MRLAALSTHASLLSGPHSAPLSLSRRSRRYSLSVPRSRRASASSSLVLMLTPTPTPTPMPTPIGAQRLPLLLLPLQLLLLLLLAPAPAPAPTPTTTPAPAPTPAFTPTPFAALTTPLSVSSTAAVASEVRNEWHCCCHWDAHSLARRSSRYSGVYGVCVRERVRRGRGRGCVCWVGER
ncbi:hypothetical protein B484DRAFT_448796 [Ochromonadaceae sp. CCMP2298]|nr:hypothetical protein B484DRAFT_448796 [Ochromonadaceae sp. CCMP2298]